MTQSEPMTNVEKLLRVLHDMEDLHRITNVTGVHSFDCSWISLAAKSMLGHGSLIHLLIDYGGHASTCPVYGDLKAPSRCNCGWNEIERALAEYRKYRKVNP